MWYSRYVDGIVGACYYFNLVGGKCTGRQAHNTGQG